MIARVHRHIRTIIAWRPRSGESARLTYVILLTLALSTALSEAPIVDEGPRCPTAAGEMMRERERREAAAERDAPDPIAWAALVALGVLASLGVRATRTERSPAP
jgi:hypothetical protein